MRIRKALAAWLAIGSIGQAVATECAMPRIPGAGLPANPVHASRSGTPAVRFHADLDVNTDGAARSYHPRDPRGQTLALNNIANAISAIYAANGTRIDCEPRRGECFQRYITTFEAARDSGWNPVGHPRVETAGIIPWRLDAATGRRVPCTIQQGPHQGYFVSQTSRAADPSRPICDQARYLDGLTLNAIVLPRSARWASQNVVADEFDVAVVRDRASGRMAFAVVGDRGPDGKMGEGTIALAAALGGRTLTGQETYQQVRAMALGSVDTVIFPTFDVQKREPGPLTQAKIDRWGAVAFAQWGGLARLDACQQAPDS